MPRVFISYSHDSDQHKASVGALAARMRTAGLQVILDQDMLPAGPLEGWPKWSQAQVRDADRVLLVCTENYCRRYEGTETPGDGLGCVCEAGVITQLLYNSGSANSKFRPVLLAQADHNFVPLEHQKYHRFSLFNSGDYEQMLAWLSGQAAAATAGIVWPGSDAAYRWSIADRIDIFEAFEKVVTGKEPRRILLISGSTNKGKTALNSELMGYAQHLGIGSVLLDLKGCPALDEVFESIRLDLGPGVLKQSYSSSGTARFHNLIADLQQLAHPLLLIFDTYEQSSADAKKWLESQLLLRIDRAPGLVVVVGGQQVPDHTKHSWRGLAQSLELQPIHEAAHWVEYIQRRWQYPAALETVEAFTLATGGNPGQLSALFESMVMGLRKKAGA